VFFFRQTTNKRNKLTFIAEPLDDGLAEQLEAGKVKLSWDKKKVCLEVSEWLLVMHVRAANTSIFAVP